MSDTRLVLDSNSYSSKLEDALFIGIALLGTIILCIGVFFVGKAVGNKTAENMCTLETTYNNETEAE